MLYMQTQFIPGILWEIQAIIWGIYKKIINTKETQAEVSQLSYLAP